MKYLIIILFTVIFLACQNPTENEKPQGAGDNVFQPVKEYLFFSDGNIIIECDSISYDFESDILHFHQDGCGLSIPEFSKYLATHNFKIK